MNILDLKNSDKIKYIIKKSFPAKKLYQGV